MRNDFRPARAVCWLTVLVVGWSASYGPCRADLWGISTDDQYSRVIRFNHEDGSELPGGIPSFSAGLYEPSGIAISGEGTIYVSSRGTGKIFFYDSATGDPLSLPGGEPGVFADLNMPVDPEGAAAPAQLRFGPDGNLYVSELFGQKVRVYDPATGVRLADAASGLPGTGGITFEPNGNLLVGTSASADPPFPATISRFQSGQPQLPFFVATQGELAYPAALLFLPNGDLLAVDLFQDPFTSSDEIERFSPSGEHLGVFATIPPILAEMPNYPSDIVFDPDGNLIVAVLGPTNPEDGNRGQLLRYGLEGNLIEVIASGLEQVGGLAWTASPLTRAGNYDSAGSVDDGDYAKWSGDFGRWVAPGNGADGNGDGIVDAADYVLWRKAEASAASGAVAPVVPEPQTILSFLTAVLVIWAARGSRRPLAGQSRGQ